MVTIKTAQEIEIMAEGGKRLAEVLHALEEATRSGITTKQLDRLAYQLIHKSGAKPGFLHYRPAGARTAYPYTLCASLNETVVHGQPSDYILQAGDLLKLDLGLIYKGLNLDSAITVVVGDAGGGVGGASHPTGEQKKLMAATRAALVAGIEEAVVGKTLGDIGFAIEAVAKKNKVGIAEGLIGHGIGRDLHEDPAVFNFGKRGQGEPLEVGMTLAIEPMFTAGAGATKTTKDDSYVTRDGSLAAHFEHTIAITENGPRVLTA